MTKRDVRFLNMHGHSTGNRKQQIGQFGDLATTLARHADNSDILRFCGLTGLHNIAGIATGRNGDQHVPRPSQRFDLAGENAFKPKIIGIGGQKRGVCGQCQRRQPAPRPLMIQSCHKFGRQMLRVSGGPAIAAKHQLAAASQALGNHFSSTHGIRTAHVCCHLLHISGCDQKITDGIFGNAGHIFHVSSV